MGLLGLLLGLSPSAHAWDSVGAVWADQDLPVPYYIASPLPRSLDDAAAVQAIRDGLQAWTDAGCGSAGFSYQGRVSDARWGEADGRNVVFVYDTAWPAEAGLLSVPALFTNQGRLVDADLAFNAQHFSLVTNDADGRTRFDVQAIATHEGGHALGLWHSTVPTASLNPSLNGNPAARSLDPDDLAGLCSLYGQTGTAGTDTADPRQSGGTPVGDSCTSSSDCVDGSFCLADRDERYCSRPCLSEDECPAGYTCLDVGGESACAVALAEESCSPSSHRGAASGLVVFGLLLPVLRRRRAQGPETSPADAP